jgi:hypothetical protein
MWASGAYNFGEAQGLGSIQRKSVDRLLMGSQAPAARLLPDVGAATETLFCRHRPIPTTGSTSRNTTPGFRQTFRRGEFDSLRLGCWVRRRHASEEAGSWELICNCMRYPGVRCRRGTGAEIIIVPSS